MNRLLREAVFSLGYNLTPKVRDADVLRLIGGLRARECVRALIRLGAHGDGGYLVPDDLEGIEYCFSPGVSLMSQFESQLADRGVRSFMADHSVAGPVTMRSEFIFDRKHVGAFNSDVFMTLDAWKNKYLPGYHQDLMLQMDIEGGEYEALLAASEALLSQFRIIIVEMHYLERLFDPFAFRVMDACFQKLLRYFYVVHLHPNNCGGRVTKEGVEIPHVVEMTFYRRDRAAPRAACAQFPHPLDAHNCPGCPPLPLPDCWR